MIEEALRDAVFKYGAHRKGCGLGIAMGQKCYCGWDQTCHDLKHLLARQALTSPDDVEKVARAIWAVDIGEYDGPGKSLAAWPEQYRRRIYNMARAAIAALAGRAP